MSLQNINVLYGVTTTEAHLSLIKTHISYPPDLPPPILGHGRHQSAFGLPPHVSRVGRRRRTQSGGRRTEYTAPRPWRPSFFARSRSESRSQERRTIIVQLDRHHFHHHHLPDNAMFDFGQLVAQRDACALGRRSAVPVAGLSESRTPHFDHQQCCPSR